VRFDQPLERDPARARAAAWWLALGLVALAGYRALALAVADLPLHFDEAQYWGWSRALEWGYYSKPPMIAVAIRAATAVCGDGEVCVRAPAYLGLALAAWFVFLAVRRLHGTRAGVLAAIAFATLPAVSLGSWAMTTDVPLVLFWSIGLYCFVRAMEQDSVRWWLATGLAGGLGLLSKYTMAMFGVSVAAYLLWEPTLRRRLRSWKPWLAAFLAFLVFAPNLWWNAAMGFPTFAHTAEISRLGRALVRPGEFALFVVGQLAVFGPVLGVALFAAIVAVALGRADQRMRLWAAFTLPLLAVVGLQALVARANLNWAAPACVAGAALVVTFLLAKARTRLIVAAIAVNAGLGLALYHLVPAASALGLPPKFDVTLRLQGWRELGAAVREVLAQHPGARLVGEDRRVIAQMMYYARPHSAGALAWDPDGRVTDHYRLVASVAAAKGGPFVIATGADLRERLARDFRGLKPLGVVEAGGCPACRRSLHLYFAEGFEGYNR
jgi:4-amino-4-deoxy-L-arabinose transferase-like glycosyltransferase